MDVLKNIRKIEDLPLEGRRVLIRFDLGVPLTPEGAVADDTRLQAAIPTIRYAIEQGAKTVLASHLGKPRGRRVPELSMLPVAERLQELLTKDMGREIEVFLPDDSVGDGPRKVVMERVEGEVVLLENLRFYAEEEANDNLFAQKLAALCDVYVDDAFASAHREYASTSAVTRHIGDKGIGLLMARELAWLGKLLTGPDAPFVVLVGGARLSDKVAYLTNLLPRAKTLAFGGAVAATLLAAKGLRMGRTRIESDRLDVAQNFLSRAKIRGVDVLLPTDLVVAPEATEDAVATVVAATDVPDDQMVVDIGPETAATYAKVVRAARTVFWNGPLGVYEKRPFLAGTETVGKALARSSAASVIGGQDTSAAAARLVLTPFFKHVSTGGGSVMAFLEGRELPALEALREAT
jgi:phosphoglycerate kinase